MQLNGGSRPGCWTRTGHEASQFTKDALIHLARDTKDVSNVTDNLVITEDNPCWTGISRGGM